MSHKQIRVKGKVTPDVVAAITAVLAGARESATDKPRRSAWSESARAAKPWRQNGRRHWRDGLRS